METILNYLNNMFLNMPDTKQVRKAKEDLSIMMEDKYNELLSEGKTDNEAVGIVISEFGNLEELSEELGLDDLSSHTYQENTYEKMISDRDAKDYVEVTTQTAKKTGIGVFLCVCSPIVLIMLSGLADRGVITEGVMICVGMSVLLAMIAVAVVIFIYNGSKVQKYDYLKRTSVGLSSSTEYYLRNLLEQEAGKSARYIAIGVVMILIGVVPVIYAAFIGDFATLAAVGLLLFLIAIAVQFFIRGGSRKEAIQVLLQEEDYTESKKKSGKIVDKIAGIYWPAATLIYLIWSFVSMAWEITWIVWPIAGVLFALIAVICNVVQAE